MGLLALFAQPFMTLHLPPPDTFKSQTIIVTGANTGLGLEAARHFVSLGASKVILGVRTLSKGLDAKADIESTTGQQGVVEVWEVNLESFASVKAFAAKAKSLERLDIAIMNAGLASKEWRVSPEGWEVQLQVNVLSTALLSMLLMPLLVANRERFPDSRPHLVLLGSDIHEQALLKERDAENILTSLNDRKVFEESNPSASERYAVSKLLNLYMSMEIADLVPSINGEPAVIVDTVAPGFCKSLLLSREPGAPLILKVLEFLTGRTLPEGSQTIVDAAVKGKDAHGKYIDHQVIARYVFSFVQDMGVPEMLTVKF